MPGTTGQRERLHRRAVVRLCGRDHLPPLGVAAFDVVAAGDLDRHLVRVGAADREPRAGEPLGRDADELLGEPLLRRVREPLVVDEREGLGLRPSRGDDVAPAVAEGRRHRAAAHRVEVPAAVRVLDPDAVAANGDRHRPPESEREDVRPVALDRRLSHRPPSDRPPGTGPGSAAVAYGTPRRGGHPLRATTLARYNPALRAPRGPEASTRRTSGAPASRGADR